MNQRPGGGGSGPAPEPAWERIEDAAAQISEQGDACAANGDYSGALWYYQQAYNKSQLEMYAKYYRKNIAWAKKMIAYDSIHQQANDAWDRKDYQGALQLYLEQQKLINGPHVRRGIADCKAEIAWSEAKTAAEYRQAIKIEPKIFGPDCIQYVENLESAEKQQQQDTTAVNKMDKMVQDYSQSADGTVTPQSKVDFVDSPANPTTTSGSDGNNGQVAFVDSSASLEDAVADTSSGSGVATGVFGTKVAKPNLTIVDAPIPGTNIKAGDQLLAVATAQTDGSLNLYYDIGGGKSAGTLVIPRESSIDFSTFSEKAKKDPRMVEALLQLGGLEARRSQITSELQPLIQARNTEKDPQKMADLTKKIDQKNTDYVNNLGNISAAVTKVQKIHHEIDLQ